MSRRQLSTRAKTGCSLCRQRRIKCDETRPACKRCTTSKRQCPGYDLPVSLITVPGERTSRPAATASKSPREKGKEASSPDSTTVVVLSSGQASPASVQSVERPPRLFSPPSEQPPFSSSAERSAFHFFRTRLLVDLPGGFFDRFLWDNTLLQIAVAQPVIRHAVLAISSLAMQSHPSTSTDKILAMSSYGRAVQGLHHEISVQQTLDQDAVLIVCLMFVLFELQSRELSSAKQHLKAGLGILLSRKPSENADPLYEKLLFGLVEMQWQMCRLFPDLKPILPSSMPPLSIHARFESIADARSIIERIRFRGTHLLWETEAAISGPSPIPPALVRKVRGLQNEILPALTSWSQKMVKFEEASSLSRTERSMVLLLWSQAIYLRLWAELDFVKGEMGWDSCTSGFEHLYQVLKSLITFQDISPLPFSGFGIEASVGKPLYYLALKARDPTLRTQGIRLLYEWADFDGGWNSSAIATAVTMVTGLEEEGLAPQSAADIPRERRVSLTSFDMNRLEFIFCYEGGREHRIPLKPHTEMRRKLLQERAVVGEQSPSASSDRTNSSGHSRATTVIDQP